MNRYTVNQFDLYPQNMLCLALKFPFMLISKLDPTKENAVKRPSYLWLIGTFKREATLPF